MQEKNLKLSEKERKKIAELFLAYTLAEFYEDERGLSKKKLMRQRIIWIQDKNFLKKNKNNKSVHSLIRKKVITAHIVGYKICIRKEYLSAIYDLADNGDLELVFQMAAVWIEPQV